MLTNCVDLPLCALGQLKPPSLHDGEIVLHGLALPHAFVSELQQLGVPLSLYNAGELIDALEAWLLDGTLIEDPEGTGFRDKLVLTAQEKDERLSRFASPASRSLYPREWNARAAEGFENFTRFL